MLRSSLEAIAPLLFGYVSSSFGGTRGGLGHSTGNSVEGAAGLDTTFLIMLIPLLAAGLLLASLACHSYPSDVAAAIASEQTTDHS